MVSEVRSLFSMPPSALSKFLNKYFPITSGWGIRSIADIPDDLHNYEAK